MESAFLCSGDEIPKVLQLLLWAGNSVHSAMRRGYAECSRRYQ